MKLKKLLSLTLAVLLCASGVAAFSSCGQSAYNIPIVCGEAGMNNVCGVATYGVDYYSLGLKAGDMAADILLDGKDVSTMPVQTDPNPALSVCSSVADEIGFTVPQSVLDKATATGVEKVTPTDAIVENNADFTVGILQLLQHEALDQANEGFRHQLSVRMKAANKTVKFDNQNASGEQSNNVTIAEQFVAQKVDLIYAIATSSAQAAAAATAETKEIPVLFNAVTNPVEAKLVADMNAPGGNVSGVSDINPVKDQVDLIAELLGKTDIKIGFLYTSAESNSVYQVGLGVEHCKAKGYEYVEEGIGDINDIQSAFIALKSAGVDAIYIPTDNVLANGAANIHSLNIGE